MPRAGLTRPIVVEQAAQLADEHGYDQLTLAALAKRVGVALPSLYKHVAGLDALKAELSLQAIGELAEAMQRAAVGRSRGDALRAVAAAYRAYVLEHPGRYAATVRVAGSADELAAERRAAADDAAQVLFAVLAGYGITGDHLVDAARALRSALHGFAAIESTGGFGLPRDIDRSFDAMVDGLDRALSSWA
ncbi:TetR/AcrR family transcriptional regulator [Phytoactinopolyspora halotolerans]|uniref:TetR/AcrR family transcriptional regulator n=1 Tax=Phytoactinopolyspora halotolerans TaxID=1981512 RepID=A0A6L9SF50_9ACTN|nr:TetR/AcrR family transcriptional regulator [Phytoactinopolyspora halotolerans]NEE02660.1 TetR/AcrR family transcriptional regulator [Phytoactinopolyspora halotolerans]